jgi:16S rRNA (cytosine967-C5)-methyltransferase
VVLEFLKKPDAKWNNLSLLITCQIQSEVLESYSKIVKPGGKLVYATCSILPSENQEQIEVSD